MTSAPAMSAMAGLSEIWLDKNPITGAEQNCNKARWPWEKIDSDVTGLSALGKAMTSSAVLKLSLADCHLGPLGLTTLAEFIPDSAAGLSVVNLSMNKCFNTDSVKALADAIPKSKIQTLVIGPKATTVPVQQADVTALDFSAQDLGPAELMMISSVMQFNAGLNDITIDSTGNLQNQKKYTIIGLQGGGASSLDLSSLNFGPADLEFLATLLTSFPSFNAGMTRIDLSSNDAITGKRSEDNDGQAPWIYGEEMAGFTAFCESLKSSAVTELNIAGCRLGPAAMLTLSPAMSAIALLSQVNLSSNKCFNVESVKALADVIPKSKLQKLVIGKDCSVPVVASDLTALDCSNQDFGPGELMLISSVVMPVSAAMTKIDISKNNIGADGAKALADVIPASKVQTLVIGDGVEISTRGSEAETLDFSNKGFGPGEVVLISALVIPFSAVISEIVFEKVVRPTGPMPMSESTSV